MLKTVSRSTALAALGASLLFSPGVHALVVEQNYVFSDSLGDSGNAAAMTTVGPGTSFFPPSQPSPIPGDTRGIPYDYRFSNGPTAMEQLAGLLGIAPSAPAWESAVNSNPNFAVGGAMTGPQPNPTGGPPPVLCCNYNFLVNDPSGLQPLTNPIFPAGFPALARTGINDQIGLFASRLVTGDIPAFDPSTTLFSVWGGPNDIFLGLALGVAGGLTPLQLHDLLQLYASNAASNIGQDVSALAVLGAQNFLLPNMPNLADTPFGLDVPALLRAELLDISEFFNSELSQTVADLRQNPALNLIEFDTFDALDNLLGSGMFANTTDPCFDRTSDATIAQSIPLILGGCQGYVFFDTVHPTTATAALLAQQMFVAIPEPSMLALLVTAGLALCWMRRLQRT